MQILAGEIAHTILIDPHPFVRVEVIGSRAPPDAHRHEHTDNTLVCRGYPLHPYAMPQPLGEAPNPILQQISTTPYD
jgi:hypothetical protein